MTAREQTAGRGRLSRNWLSPRDANIYATLFFTAPKEALYLANLGQVGIYSCATILQDKGFAGKIKWPNDLLIEGKKIAGALSETFSFNECIGVALGIGINVNMEEADLKTIDQPATSLKQLSNKPWELEPLLKLFVEQFAHNLSILEEKGFAPFHSAFNDLLAYRGKEISVDDGAKTVHGICRGITLDGKLELQTSSGHLMILTVGDIS